MRWLIVMLSLFGVGAGGAAAAGDAVAPQCPPGAPEAASPSAFMKSLQMNEPMPGAMSKEGTMKGDVAEAARAKEACMRDAVNREQATMTETKVQPDPAR
jgi:hypothetical protein